MSEAKKEYVPFGPEWEAEMKKLPKAVLIDMIKNNLHKKKYEPSLEDIQDLVKFRPATPEQAQYIRGISHTITDSKMNEYHVINGNVYILD